MKKLLAFLGQHKNKIGASILTLSLVMWAPRPVKAVAIIDTVEKLSEVAYALSSPIALNCLLTRTNAYTSPRTLFFYSLTALSAASLSICGAIKNVQLLKAMN